MFEPVSYYDMQIGYRLRLPVAPVLAMAGVEQHSGYPLVLMAAAFAADRNGQAQLALEYGDAALAAEHALRAPRPYSLDLTATRSVLAAYIATSSGAYDEAAAAYIDAIDRYRRTNSMGHAANFLNGAAAALCLGGRFDDAVPFATEGIALARTNGAPSSVTGNLVALAQALSRREPERARVLLEEAAHTDYSEYYGSLVQLTVAAAMTRDWPLAARFAARSIPLIHWINHRPYLFGILTISARVLSAADPEAAATIQGAAHTLTMSSAPTTMAVEAPEPPPSGRPQNRPGLFVETRRETTEILVQAIGDERLRALREPGAALDTDSAVAYTLTRLDAYLAENDET